MGEQSATRLEGDRYQHLYSWFELLKLLDDDCPYDHAWVEHPAAGAADDLTFHPKPGLDRAARFVQVKFHVDLSRHYSFDELVSARKGEKPLLRKLFESWKPLRASGRVEVWLVSNWSAAPKPDLGRFIEGRTYSLLERFFSAGKNSLCGRKRRFWRKVLGASAEELDAFCRDLRLRLSYSSIDELADKIDDRMGNYDLKRGENARAAVLDEISARIEVGDRKKRFTRGDIIEIIERRELRADHPDAPTARLWVHGWSRQGWDQRPTVQLDWTAHFNRAERRIASAGTWASTLLPALESARDHFASRPDGKYIDFRGKVPLTASIAVGATFSEVQGFRFRAEQPSGGELFLWRSDSTPTGAQFVVKHEEGKPGPNLLAMLAITGDGLPDARRMFESARFDALLYLEPAGGTGPTAVRSAGDAVALADSAKQAFRTARAKYGTERIHLIPYGPAAFCLFLGQKLNALGVITTYERTAEGGYQASAIIPTG